MNTTDNKAAAGVTENHATHTLECKSLLGVASACLVTLVFFNVVQVLAAFFGVEPHPPFAVVPMIVGTAGMGIAALVLIRNEIREGYFLAIAFSVVSMIGMGPHKLLMENGLFVAPVALLGFVAELVLIVVAFKYILKTRNNPS